MNTKNNTYFSSLALCLLLSAATATAVDAQTYEPYTFTTFAGNPAGPLVNGTSTAARFRAPYGVAVDNAGNAYVADTTNHTIRKITPAGDVSTFAGLAATAGSNDGAGSEARFNSPKGVAVDSTGTVYVADTGNHTIRQITSAGVVSTLAGLALSSGNADGTGTAARFSLPNGAAVDGSGNLYVADSNNHTIRKVDPGAVVSTFAGLAGKTGSADGAGAAARFTFPSGVAVGGAGIVYVADNFNNTIRKITATGDVTTLAGTAGFLGSGSADGAGSAARFNQPSGVAVDSGGNVYVADTNNSTVRKVTAFGQVTTVAGMAGSRGSIDGIGSAALFASLRSIAVDSAGNLFAADTGNNTIRRITPTALVSTFAGSPSVGSADGVASAARFDSPQGTAMDSAGNLYVTDTHNQTIRKISASGNVTTLAGLAGTAGSVDGTGSAARFTIPGLIVVDSFGTVYVADRTNHTIRKITAAGDVSTLAGLAGSAGNVDGTGSAARFNFPSGLALDASGNVYVADTFNNAIRKVTPGGNVTTVASFVSPGPIALDSAGNIYIAKFDGIKIIAPDASVTSIPASLGNPTSIARDTAGNMFVTDAGGSVIRKVTPAGVMTILGRLQNSAGSSDGTGSVARFTAPSGLTLDSGGNIYLADTFNHCIRKGSLLPAAITPIGSQLIDAGSVGTTSIDLTFDNVTKAGTTTVAQIDPAYAGNLPSAYELAGANLAYEISTTATYQGSILIAFQVSVDPAIFSQLRIFHNENGTLVDRTASIPAPEPLTQTIYARVPSLSPFVIAKPIAPPLTATVQSPINADGSSVFTIKRGVVPVKFTLAEAGAPTCVLPSATILLTRTAGGTTGSVNEALYPMAADNGSAFRIDSCQYIYNLNSSALSMGTYRADIQINGSTVGSATFQLK